MGIYILKPSLGRIFASQRIQVWLCIWRRYSVIYEYRLQPNIRLLPNIRFLLNIRQYSGIFGNIRQDGGRWEPVRLSHQEKTTFRALSGEPGGEGEGVIVSMEKASTLWTVPSLSTKAY